MTAPDVDTSRRNFLRATAGTAAIAAGTGSAAAAESGGGGGGGAMPDWGGYLSSANNYNDSTEDMRGQDEVTIRVGAGDGLAFGPAAAWVSTGTTVTWEWTGEGGSHNVVADDGPIDSGAAVGEAGTTYSVTFEEGGIYTYYCSPHQGQGMLGAIAVGDDVPTVQPSTGGGGPTLPDNAKMLGIASGFAMTTTLGLAYLFMRYGGDYEGDV